MKCPKCGKENDDNAKFCKGCGDRLKKDIIKVKPPEEGKDKKIIIALIVIVVILLAGVLLYASGVFSSTELETKNFDGFTIDVPVDSNFVIDQSYTTNPNNIFVSYINNGKHTPGYTLYEAFKPGSDANVIVYGTDLDVVKRMANSFKDNNFKSLATTPSEPTTPTTSTPQTATPAATTSTPITILGGSFSTGSGLSDKTYASIYVGPEHAGKSVKVQIFYSRDGVYLNNGNIVPKTVTSNGYIEVASADAYSQYPDFAEINLYDSSGNLIDYMNVALNPTSGTQTF